MTQVFPSPIMNAPVMPEGQVAERENLHGLLGTAIANMIGAPDERRHLTDTLSFLTDRLNQIAIVTQVRVLQMQMDLAANDLAVLQKPSQTEN
ncbi:hypothetical protein FNL55_13145 [Tardiphaga sp. vice352]|uniref:hypothetical protein n=1 Tax=Tardiphaga sp. vice352 TaxID=2592816 RepID=UPI001163BD73|nr:hypothetical protein [Tardiphaga sp. vice352]QDM32177.1 hypothetical protein FNL55_13145 [Tardiphaga sp. vice352]